jgi:tRNA G18 (ribose-2'-O)-methylase SpoU
MIVESKIALEGALEEGVEVVSLLVDERRLESCAYLIERIGGNAPVYAMEHEAMSSLVGFKVTRGVLAACKRPQALSVHDVLARSRNLCVAEGLVDVSNMGALFRSAAALGVDGIIVSPECTNPLSRRAIRVSMGNVFKLPWLRLSGAWPQPFIEDLKEAGFERLALALVEGACDVSDPRLKDLDRVALFFGSEGYGLSLEVVEACDHKVIIPMMGGVDSLNVAASTAVALWELFDRGVQHS